MALITGRTTDKEQRPKPVRSFITTAFLGIGIAEEIGYFIVVTLSINSDKRQIPFGTDAFYCNQTICFFQVFKKIRVSPFFHKQNNAGFYTNRTFTHRQKSIFAVHVIVLLCKIPTAAVLHKNISFFRSLPGIKFLCGLRAEKLNFLIVRAC